MPISPADALEYNEDRIKQIESQIDKKTLNRKPLLGAFLLTKKLILC